MEILKIVRILFLVVTAFIVGRTNGERIDRRISEGNHFVQGRQSRPK